MNLYLFSIMFVPLSYTEILATTILGATFRQICQLPCKTCTSSSCCKLRILIEILVYLLPVCLLIYVPSFMNDNFLYLWQFSFGEPIHWKHPRVFIFITSADRHVSHSLWFVINADFTVQLLPNISCHSGLLTTIF